MTYDASGENIGNIPHWHGAATEYRRAWMILGHLHRNGYQPDATTEFKVRNMMNADMAVMISTLQGGNEADVRLCVERNLRFLPMDGASSVAQSSELASTVASLTGHRKHRA
jgi:hypothetical protein